MDNRKRKGDSEGTRSKVWKGQDSDDGNVVSAPIIDAIPNITNDEEKLTQESAHLTNVDKFFPDLVWKTVLKKLKQPKDIENCSNSSPYFGTNLKKERESKIVLPKVFDILGQRYFNQTDESYIETNTGSIPWERPSTKPDPNKMTGFWKCRLVCKSWNKAIEGLHRDNIIAPFYLKNYTEEKFSYYEEIEKFLLHFDATHYDSLKKKAIKNPFLKHTVWFNYRWDGQENIHVFNESILELVQKYGEYIWYLHFAYFNTNFDGDDGEDNRMRSIIEFYNTFRQMLLCTPNLKRITISCNGWSSFFTVSPQQLQNLKLEISRNPLPKLANLIDISTDQMSSSVLNELLDRNRHIKHLHINSIKSIFMLDSCGPSIESLTNLQELGFRFYTLDDFELFQKLPCIFQQKQFKFEYYARAPFIPWSNIFKVVEAKIDTRFCTELSLNLPNARSDEERKLILKESLEIKLNIPNITYISISTETNFTLDFLENFSSSLKFIVLYKQFNYEKVLDELLDKQIIQYLGYEDQLQDSNIWKSFPQLRMISIFHSDRYLSYNSFGDEIQVSRRQRFTET